MTASESQSRISKKRRRASCRAGLVKPPQLTSRPRFAPNVPINDIQVISRNGNDRVFYNLTGALNGPRNVQINMGTGNNRFVGTIRRDLLPAANLNINVNSGAGNDRIVLNQIGSLQPGSAFSFNANAGGGNNNVVYQTTNLVSIGAGSFLGVNLNSGGGNDTLLTRINAVDNGQIQANTSTGGQWASAAGSGRTNDA